MLNPFFLMAMLFLSLAALGALDASLASFALVPWFNGLRWLRVHLVNIGVIAEVAFGALPILAAWRAGRPRPKTRWDIWLALNAGLLILLAGIPLINAALIIAGGALIFLAAVLLLFHLAALRGQPSAPGSSAGRKFYIVALSYLLLGIFLGTGMWLGWGKALHLQGVKEVHVHANLWGFASMLFAGLIVDLYLGFARRPLAWPRSIHAIFWMMTLGALGLVVGPWTRSDFISTVGLVVHTAGTLLLLANMVKPLAGDRRAWTPGMLHLVTAYVWLLVPTIMAPLIVLNAPGFPVAEVESNGGPILVYGWMLQIGYALMPYLFARFFLPGRPARLGGSWFSLLAVQMGAIFFLPGLFFTSYQSVLHGIAFGLWLASLMPVAWSLWRVARAGLANAEERGAVRRA